MIGLVSMCDDPTYTYDPNGNLSSRVEGSDTWGYEWNANNELTRVTKNSIEEARFAYDPLGRRVEKVAGGVTTRYTYQGANILREARGATTLTYVHGPRVDEAIGADDGTALSYFHADGLGSIAGRTDAAGTVTLLRRYQVWGQLETGASEAGYAFTGREWDPEVSLYYYRSRYYSPETGRFIGEDPIRFRGGNNFYTYVSDSPAGRVDPFGLSDCCPEQKCPSGVWYGGGVTGGGGWGTYSGPSGSFSVVRVTCWGKPTLTADVAFGCGGQGVAFVPRPLQAYMGISLDGVVCTAACKADLLGTSKGGSGSFFMGVGASVSVTTGSSTCVAAGPGVGVGFKAMGMGCYGGDVM